MALPIVIVTSGGIAITESTNGFGLPVEIASNGFGIAATLVDSGGLAVLGSSGGSPALPTAPVLAMDPAWDTTQSTPLWIIDAAWADQDDLQFEVQVSLGDWSGATITNHTVITSEITGTTIDLPSSTLVNGDYEARCKFKHSGGSYSTYSNTVSFTIAAVANGIELEATTDLIELEDTTDTILLEDAA